MKIAVMLNLLKEKMFLVTKAQKRNFCLFSKNGACQKWQHTLLCLRRSDTSYRILTPSENKKHAYKWYCHFWQVPLFSIENFCFNVLRRLTRSRLQIASIPIQS